MNLCKLKRTSSAFKVFFCKERFFGKHGSLFRVICGQRRIRKEACALCSPCEKRNVVVLVPLCKLVVCIPGSGPAVILRVNKAVRRAAYGRSAIVHSFAVSNSFRHTGRLPAAYAESFEIARNTKFLHFIHKRLNGNMGVIPMDKVKIEIVNAHTVKAVHKILVDKGRAYTNEFLMQAAFSVDKAVAAFVGNHYVFSFYLGAAKPAVKNLFAFCNAVAFSVITAGINHCTAAFHIKVHHFVCFLFCIKSEPRCSEYESWHWFVKSSYVNVLHN